MRFSARHASTAAALALVLVFMGIAGFVLMEMIETRALAARAHDSQEISRAYEDARLRVVVAQLAATKHLGAPTPLTRAAFDTAVDEALHSLELLRAVGAAEDRAVVDGLYEKELPALESVKRIFLALEQGLPITEKIPAADTVDRILAQLEPLAVQRAASSTEALNGVVDNQSRSVEVTVAVCAVGLLFVLGLIFAARAFGRKEALHEAEVAGLRTAALTDSLTGLGNHRAFIEELRRQVERSTRHSEPLALAMIDIDEFKNINDTWGHSGGDVVLREVAALLTASCRAGDYAFRIGGDEFAIIFPQAGGEDILKATEKLRAAAPRVISNGPTFSIGIATVDTSKGDKGVLTQQADSALYEAKRRGRNAAVLFTLSEGAQPIFPAAKIAELRSLLADDAITAVFQPIWNLNDGTLIGHEAFARIPAQYGISGPSVAFDIAGRIGKSAELDQTCRKAILAGARSIPGESLLFVNVSPYSLGQAAFSASAVVEEFQRAGLDAARVVLEISARSTVPVPIIEAAIISLRQAGFKIALDDVGAANAGFELLRKVPVEYVKVDRTILLSARSDKMSRAVLMGIVTFASGAGTLVIAEGVEDESTMEFVRSIAIGDEADASTVYGVQGYLLGYPSAQITTGTSPVWLAAA